MPPTREIEPAVSLVYKSSVPLYTGDTDTIVIHCSQHNYQQQIDDLMRNYLQRASYDRLAIPGGPQFFLSPGYMPKFEWAGKKWTEFLIVNHHLKEVVLIGHAVCAWNSAVSRLQDPLEVKKYMCQSLRVIQDMTKKSLPTLTVHAFFAEPNAQDLVDFSNIS